MQPAALEVPKKPNGSEALAVTSPTPMDLLQIAITQDVSIEKLAQLMELQQKWEASEARKAFVAAMNAFKANPPSLEKIKKVDFSSKSGNRVNYNYAPLDHINHVLGAELSKHGLSFRWKVEQSDTGISVTCILEHRQGHFETVRMTAGLHTDDRMNPIQRLGSTITYLERYTLLAATGMATQEADTDGNTHDESNTIPDERYVQLRDAILGANNDDELKRAYQLAIQEAKEAKDDTSARDFQKAKNNRYKELHSAGR